MRNYLTDFKESAQYERIKHLIPHAICPFLYYNTLPYVFTLANRGWFIWVKKTSAPSERRKVNNKDNFAKSAINKLYPNEVLVRCPNPRSMVVAGLGPWPENKIKIRVLYSSGSCLMQHKAADEVIIDREDKAERVLELNRVFPQVMTLAFTPPLCTGAGFSGVSVKEDNDFCRIADKAGVDISEIIHNCRYHREKHRIKPELLRDGFCPHLFQAIYPYVLAKMYGADIEGTIKIKCPKKEGGLTLALERTSRIRNSCARAILGLLKKLCALLYRPVDVMDYNLEIKVLQNELGRCDLEKGKNYSVNLRDEHFLCPASFHTVYPYLLLTAGESIMAWDGKAEGNLTPCPDCVGTVYSLNKK